MLIPVGPSSPINLPVPYRGDDILDHPELDYWLARPADAIDELDRIECEESLLAFTKRHWHILEPGRELSIAWPLEAVCEHLEAITYGQISRLLINVPPGFMKSLLCNVFWPAWEWGARGLTSLRYVNFSYSSHLTERDNRRFKDVLLSHDFGRLFGDRVGALTKTGEQLVSNSHTGWKLATSVGGVGTGERGDRVVLDDPHNVKQGESEDVRRSTTDWFREAMQNRVNDRNSAIAVIMQRVHDEDVSGVILSEMRHEYEHLCYDDQTEVLTQDGWVRFPQLQEGVPVMAVNPATLEADWQVPTHYTRLQHDGELIAYKSRTADLVVTPDHRMVYGDLNDMRGNEMARWRVRPAKDLPGLFHLPQVVKWRGSSEAITLGGVEWEPSVYAEFMGWYLSEGCTSVKSCMTRIVQKRDGKHVDALVKCLSRIPMPKLNRRRNNDVMDVWAIGSKVLARDLEPLGKSKNKRAPGALKNLPPEHLKTFLYAYALGDGQFQKINPLKIVITTASRQMADDLQECAMKAGMASSISHSKDGAYRVYLRASKVGGKRKVAALITQKHTSRVAYSGTVYCVSVPATALVVRRNSRVSVSGNCIPYEWEGATLISTVPQMHWNSDPRTVVGEEAWPERIPTTWRSFKITLGPYAVASQYQQRPTPRGGAIFKRDWWQPWDPPPVLVKYPDGHEDYVQRFPACEFIIASLDGAFGQKQENDWTAFTIWGVFRQAAGVLPSSTRAQRSYVEQVLNDRLGAAPGVPMAASRFSQAPNLILMNAWRKRLPLNGLEVEREAHETDAQYRQRSMKEWGIVQWVIHSCQRLGVSMLLVEAKANGHDVASEVQRQMGGQRFGVRLIDPGKLDKIGRAYAVQHIWADAMVYAPVDEPGSDQYREWADAVISEMTTFPKGGHDDFTDTATQVVKWLRDNGMLQHAHEMERALAEELANNSKPIPKPLYPT